MADESYQPTVLEAALAVAKAVEANAVALMGASDSIREVIEHYREQASVAPSRVTH